MHQQTPAYPTTTTAPAVHFTATDILTDLWDRLDRARADLTRATQSGYGQESASTRVCTLAGLLATYDPALQDDDTFLTRMTDTQTAGL